MPKRNLVEKNEVVIPCLRRLSMLKTLGRVFRYKRVEVGDKGFTPGDPDIEIYLIHKRILHLIYVECKRPMGGVIRSKQRVFIKDHCDIKNVVTAIVRYPKQIDELVDSIKGDPLVELSDDFIF